MKLDPILVAVDFSPVTDAILRTARLLAGEGGTIRLLHAVDTALLPHATYISADVIDNFYSTLQAQAGERIAALARELEGFRVETTVTLGRPADAIVGAAARAAIVLVGAHGRSAAGRFFLGSVAEEVARRSPVPTLVVRERAEGRRPVQRVLVAHDVVDPCDDALRAGAALAARIGARLEVIHVVPWPVEARAARGAAELRARLIEEMPRALRAQVSKTIGESAAITVRIGPVAAEITRWARPHDIIVCGTHGRGTLGRLAFGSIATSLSRRAPCPLLLVKPGSFPAGAPALATAAVAGS